MAANTRLHYALRILWLLSRGGKVTVNDMHEYFEAQIEKRSLQRILKTLSEADFPITSETGPHNEQFYSIERPFGHIPTKLNVDEVLAALLLSQFAGVFGGTRIGEDIKAVFTKLEQLLPPDMVNVQEPFGSGHYLYMRQAGTADIDTGGMLQTVFEAMLTGHVCRVQYRERSFRLHPYSLLLYNGVLYLVGYQPKHRHIIFLVMGRMRAVEILEQKFTRDSNFRLEQHFKENFGIWAEAPTDVRIRFDATVRPSIEQRHWHHSQRFEESGDGGVILTMHVGPSLELDAWILRWGAHAEVLEPASLRKRIRDTARAMVAKHTDARPKRR